MQFRKLAEETSKKAVEIYVEDNTRRLFSSRGQKPQQRVEQVKKEKFVLSFRALLGWKGYGQIEKVSLLTVPILIINMNTKATLAIDLLCTSAIKCFFGRQAMLCCINFCSLKFLLWHPNTLLSR